MFSSLPEAAPDSRSQPPPSCLTAMVPSPSKPRAAELVLQRMQQFKRADPERLKHGSEGCSLEAALEENVPKGPQEMMAGNGMMGVLCLPNSVDFRGRESGRSPCSLRLCWGWRSTFATLSRQRTEGPLGHFSLSFFDKVPLPLFFILTFYYKIFPFIKVRKIYYNEVPMPSTYI